MQIEIKLDESCKEPKIIIHTGQDDRKKYRRS